MRMRMRMRMRMTWGMLELRTVSSVFGSGPVVCMLEDPPHTPKMISKTKLARPRPQSTDRTSGRGIYNTAVYEDIEVRLEKVPGECFIGQHLFYSLCTSCGCGMYIPGECFIAQFLFYSLCTSCARESAVK